MTQVSQAANSGESLDISKIAAATGLSENDVWEALQYLTSIGYVTPMLPPPSLTPEQASPARDKLCRDLTGEASVRLVYLIGIALFVAAAIVFVVQNRDSVTISFLGLSVSAPVAILSAIMYLLGAATGGSLFALLRHSVRKL